MTMVWPATMQLPAASKALGEEAALKLALALVDVTVGIVNL